MQKKKNKAKGCQRKRLQLHLNLLQNLALTFNLQNIVVMSICNWNHYKIKSIKTAFAYYFRLLHLMMF